MKAKRKIIGQVLQNSGHYSTVYWRLDWQIRALNENLDSMWIQSQDDNLTDTKTIDEVMAQSTLSDEAVIERTKKAPIAPW